MSKQRFDSAKIRATFDADGFLSDKPIVARIGLQVYGQGDKQVREFRPASEVFHADSLSSFQGKPITIGHVTVNSKNAKAVMVGACSGVAEKDSGGIGVAVPITIHADEAINRAKSKANAEISVGYKCDVIEESGWGSPTTGEYILDSDRADSVHIPADWVEFDALQTNIRVNHVALVYRGRAGIAKLNMDSEQEFDYDCFEFKTDNEGVNEMVKLKLDGAVEFEVDPAVAAHVTALQVKADTAESQLATVTADRDTLKVKVDGIDALIEAAKSDAITGAKVRVDLEATAKAAGVTFKADATDKEIKVAFIEKVSGIKDAASKEDAYINAAFDIALNSNDISSQRATIKPSKVKEDGGDEMPTPNSRLATLKK